MANTMTTTNQTSTAFGPRALRNHEAVRTRYNAWSQQWWNNNFREREHDEFIVAAVIAGFRREVKLNYGPEAVLHIPVMPEELHNISVNSIGERRHEAEDNFEYKTASFGNVHVLDDDTCDNTRPTSRVCRASRDRPDSTKPKVQSESLLRRAELDSGDEDSSVPSARVSPPPIANPFRADRSLPAECRPKTKTYARRQSQDSNADNSDKEDKPSKADDSDEGHHSTVNDFARTTQVRSPQRTRSGAADCPISPHSNVTLDVDDSSEK